ncbi:GGDEF domain-containing protein [Shewanella rhizosphaerae]|uniref:GGDEF domain-containing protein n=1 Tax=Shewanella rhizosphaerae TaxID=2864207 RepID=UPI001C660754|nr:GGDEF domain-containing protein [Shewanella rhizosphaerae]QYK11402.1 GGDEF domain-containing protein [Shewanella rhizosphaerae]
MPSTLAAPYSMVATASPRLEQSGKPFQFASAPSNMASVGLSQISKASASPLHDPSRQASIASSWLGDLKAHYSNLLLHYLAPLIAIALVMQRVYRQASALSRTRLEQAIDERTQALQLENLRLQEMSHRDPLTGLKNRRFIEEMIAQDLNRVDRSYDVTQLRNEELPSKADLLALIIDIDHFKPINDTYGHLAGDRVLSQVGQRLTTLFRNYDYVVRWGGEEFLVVARFIDRQEIDQLAEKVRHAIESMEIELDAKRTIKITASVGAAPYPFSTAQADKLRWEQVVHLADMALYQAKTSSRNTWVSYMGSNQLPIPDELQLDPAKIPRIAMVSSKPLSSQSLDLRKAAL